MIKLLKEKNISGFKNQNMENFNLRKHSGQPWALLQKMTLLVWYKCNAFYKLEQISGLTKERKLKNLFPFKTYSTANLLV